MNTLKLTLLLFLIQLGTSAQSSTLFTPGNTTLINGRDSLTLKNGLVGIGTSQPDNKIVVRNVPLSTYGLSLSGSLGGDASSRVMELVTPDFNYDRNIGSAVNFFFNEDAGNTTMRIEAWQNGKSDPANLSIQTRPGFLGVGTIYPKAKLHVDQGDIYIENIYSGLIMKSPNGNCWRVKVNNDGSFASSFISCPN